jgi:hypothetical protein
MFWFAPFFKVRKILIGKQLHEHTPRVGACKWIWIGEIQTKLETNCQACFALQRVTDSINHNLRFLCKQAIVKQPAESTSKLAATRHK